MHIRHVKIENIRRFGEGPLAVDLTLPPRGWVVIAGRNGAGKTTLLQVIALALSGTFPHEYADTMFSVLRQGAALASSRVAIVPSDDDALQADVKVFSTKTTSEELVVGDGWRPFHGAMEHSREGDQNRAFAGPWHANPRGWFAVGYGAHRRLLGQASALDDWATGTTRESAFLTLFRDDASLVHPVRWLMDLNHRSLDDNAPVAERRSAKAIVTGVVGLLNDALLGDCEVLGVDSYGLSVRQAGQKLSIRNLGAGAQSIAALVIDMLRHMHARFGALRFTDRDGHPIIEHSGVVLIDEADAHFHVAWQQRIGPWFTTHFPNLQFIVTTHSPFVCQSAVEGGLILLPPPGSPEPARVAGDDLYRRVVNGSIDDALLSELFGLEHTWSPDAERRRERLATLEARVLTGKASRAEKAEYKRLLEEVPQTLSDEVERASKRLDASRKAARGR